MNRLTRVNALKIAALLSLFIGLVSFFGALPLLAQGAAALDANATTPPFVVVMVGFIFAILRIIAAPSTWQGQRWGIIVTLVANAIDAVAAAPGLLFAPTTELLIFAIATLVLGIIIIALCFWRDRKPVLAT